MVDNNRAACDSPLFGGINLTNTMEQTHDAEYRSSTYGGVIDVGHSKTEPLQIPGTIRGEIAL